MKTLKDVPPYCVAYRIWDTVEDIIVFESKDFEEIVAVYRTCFTTQRFPRSPISKSDWITIPRYVVKTEFNDELDLNEIYRYRWVKYRERETDKLPDIRYKKGNPNKIKPGYYCWGHWWDEEHPKYYHHPYKVYGCYRRVRSTNERRQNAGAVAEYGDSVVRGRRRGKNLPDSWDDYINSTHYAIKSWKHHSKRRKQWKPKD